MFLLRLPYLFYVCTIYQYNKIYLIDYLFVAALNGFYENYKFWKKFLLIL